jgi:putative peptide zinc metalloprotease protein
MYSRAAVVAVQPFTRQREGDDVVIGRPETGIFLAIPPEAVEVLDHLAQGKTIGEVADFYLQKYGEAPDMEDFLGLLEAKGIVRAAQAMGPAAASHPLPRQQPAPVRYHFSSFPVWLAQLIFGRTASVVAVAVILAAIAAVMRHPQLAPRLRDLYFPDHRTLCFAILLAGAYLSLFVHEFGHLVAARALNINSRMGVSHRLWYLVAETDLTGLWSVPKQKRYLPLVAGTLVDLVFAAVFILLLYAGEEKLFLLPILLARVLRAMVFTYVARAAWQCFLFIRTDLYYVIANFFNCKNLLKDTEAYLRNCLARVVRGMRTVDQSAVPESELRVIRVYAWVWVAGRIAAFAVLIAITLPLGAAYMGNLATAFRAGYSAHPSDFVDALLLATSFLVPFIAGLTLWIGGMLRRERT